MPLAPATLRRRLWTPSARLPPASIRGVWNDSTGDRGGTGTWPDCRGSGPNLTFTTLANSGTQKGRYTVDIGGYYGTATFTNDQPFSILIACKFDAWSGTNQALTDGTTGAVRIRRVTETQLQINAGNNLTSDAISGLEEWNVVGATFNGASSSIWLNGVPIKTGNAGTNNAGGLVLGALSGGGTPFSGEIAEVHDVNALTATQMMLDSWFLSRRWL